MRDLATIPDNGRSFVPPELTRAAAWLAPDLSVLEGGRVPAPTFPLEILGAEWSMWAQDAAEGKSAPVDYVAGSLLSIASALIGNSRWAAAWPDSPASWREPPVLWCGLVGSPSSGKSPGADAVLDLVSVLDAELAADFPDRQREFDTDKESAAQRRKKWEGEVADAIDKGHLPPQKPVDAVEPTTPLRPRVRVMDATVEAQAALLISNPRGLLLHRDELAGLLDGFGRYGSVGADRAFFLESYGGRPYIVDRKKQNNEPLCVPYLTVALIGGIQPDRLHTCLLDTADDGAQSRFLWFWPNAVLPSRPKPSASTSDPALPRLRRLLSLQMGRSLDTGTLCPGLVALTEKAADALAIWRERHFHFANSQTGAFATHLGKMPGMALRLSLVLELLWWSSKDGAAEPTAISREAVDAATHFLDGYAAQQARRVFGTASLPEPDRLGLALAQWIVAGNIQAINRRAVYRGRTRPPEINTPEKADMAIKALVEADWLRSRDAAGAAHRPKADYDVNPLVHVVAA